MLHRGLMGCLLLCCSIQANAQQAPPLTDDQQQAIGAISEHSVKGALYFLASDALEGRGTPSRGFDIACEYVATQFAAAGLEGLGDNGSYFQLATVPTLQTPAEGVGLKNEAGLSLTHHGLLSGGETDFNFDGPIERVQFGDEFEAQTFSGPVLVSPLTGNSRSMFRELAQVGRLANTLKSRGATAILLQCDADSQLVEHAKTLTTPKLENRQTRMSLPVLLVSNIEVPDANAWEGNHRIAIPKQIREETVVRNTIGILRGSDPELSGEALVITAHLDHLGIDGTGEDRIYNGADDNASGCTAVISLATAFASLQTPPKRSIIFITFWGEERGLLGSKYFVENPLWPLQKIVANINIEMIGRPEAGATHKCWVTGWDQSDLGPIMALGSTRANVEIFQHPRYSAMLYRASDNYSFVQKGVIAHSFSAGSLHGDYHQPSDEVEVMNTEHMTQVIQGLFAGALLIADGQFTPTPTQGSSGR